MAATRHHGLWSPEEGPEKDEVQLSLQLALHLNLRHRIEQASHWCMQTLYADPAGYVSLVSNPTPSLRLDPILPHCSVQRAHIAQQLTRPLLRHSSVVWASRLGRHCQQRAMHGMQLLQIVHAQGHTAEYCIPILLLLCQRPCLVRSRWQTMQV